MNMLTLYLMQSTFDTNCQKSVLKGEHRTRTRRWMSNMLKIFKSCSDLDIEPRSLEIEIAWDVIILNIFVKLY